MVTTGTELFSSVQVFSHRSTNGELRDWTRLGSGLVGLFVSWGPSSPPLRSSSSSSAASTGPTSAAFFLGSGESSSRDRAKVEVLKSDRGKGRRRGRVALTFLANVSETTFLI